MTALAVLLQVASLACMWRIYATHSAPAEDGESNPNGGRSSEPA